MYRNGLDIAAGIELRQQHHRGMRQRRELRQRQGIHVIERRGYQQTLR